MTQLNVVYVFNGEGGRFPGGVFTSYANASKWIGLHRLTGILTAYPLDTGLYDWALDQDFFEIKKEYQRESKFIQNFSCAASEHYHFENGIFISEG
jgi:hypothetical protein